MNARKAKRKIYQLQRGQVKVAPSLAEIGMMVAAGRRAGVATAVKKWRQSPEGRRMAAAWASASMQNDEDVVAAEHRTRAFWRLRPR